MVYIVKNGVVDVSFGKDNPVLESAAGERGFNPEKIRSTEMHSKVILPKKIETPSLKTNTDHTNFRTNTTKTSLAPSAMSDLYTAANLINNNQKNVAKDRIVSIYLKKDRYLENQSFNLINNGFYDTKKSSFQNLGNFEKTLVAPVRKIDTDNNGIKFDYSVKGFKNVEAREILNHPVPIKKDMSAIHTPISIISNGTKTTYKVKS